MIKYFFIIIFSILSFTGSSLSEKADENLEEEIQEMIDVFNSDKVPESNKLCKNCAYARQRSVIDKL